MDEKNQSEPPQRYIWPWFALGFLVLGIVLAIVWMSVLVHRVREQRENNMWPAPKRPTPTRAIPVSPTPATNTASTK